DDFNELKLTFGINSLNVGEFENLGDRHFGGQRTLRVNLDDVDIIFKPRSTTPESFLNCVVALTELDKYKVLEKEDHGWCQYLPHDDIEVNESLHFYLGAMQALVHVTSTKDTHKENIVIHNSRPYLIDAECTISCSMDITNNRFYYSNNIYDYGIIPFYWKDVDYCNRNVSYLGWLYSGLKFYNDDINLWRQEFLDGFISTYTRLINELDYFECIINHYSNNLNSRIVLRNTSYYSSL
ncbi:DUF4135 domain-containing protein, partial [Salmonella enterica subsp. enterica serovar Colindale]|nr:DUF4135 domain-containing protein [Salmonella enterica subsp. enterica serovar Colindale]